jgi:hypothetical protein
MRLTVTLLLTFLLALPGTSRAAELVPVSNVTDLNHPHQDVGDNFNILAANFSVYYRGGPRENEAALREALPALYLAFQTGSKN